LSKYRLEFQNSRLVRTKRRALLWWVWTFNRSEEDDITKLKNVITKMSDQLYQHKRRLPKLEADLEARKNALRLYIEQSGKNYGPSWTDSYSSRKSPTVLMEPAQSAKVKKDKKASDGKPPDALLAKLVIPTDKK
jgi:hypothetical protein